jgi:hypothetical protein
MPGTNISRMAAPGRTGLAGLGLELIAAAMLTIWPDSHLIAYGVAIVGALFILWAIADWLRPRRVANNSKISPAQERWIPIRDACAWIVEHTAERIERFQGGHRIFAATLIRQSARDGKIAIQGRRQNMNDSFSLVWSDIPAEYWQTHQFDLLTVVGDESVAPKVETEPENVWSGHAMSLPVYTQLRVPEHRIRELWPARK